MTTDTRETAPSPEGAGEELAHRRHRVHRLTLSAEDRRAAMDALMLRPSRRIVSQYAILLMLSIVVATMGLLMGSTAVVIGAMMIAPLMAPIMGMSASITMGWGGRLTSTALIVGASIVGSVALAWALARFVPLANTGLPGELLSRSSPDIRDLVVALAAGAAGSYATVRKDVSGALPGVAVAVALVPPLAAAGVFLGLDQLPLARGAGLLFAANLFGIMLAASIVFVVTGFVPARRRRRTALSVVAIVLVAIPVGVLAVLLGSRFAASVTEASNLRLATQTTVNWMGPDSADTLETVVVGDDATAVTVEVSGPVAPGPTGDLAADLTAAFGRPMSASVLWVPVRNGEEPVAPPTLALGDVRPVVEEWLAERGLALTGLSTSVGSVVVDALGPQAPEDVLSLEEALATAFGARPSVSLSWTQSTPEVVEQASVEDLTLEAARSWAAGLPDVVVLGVQAKPDALQVVIAGGTDSTPAELYVHLRSVLPEQSFVVTQVPSASLGDLGPGLADGTSAGTVVDEAVDAPDQQQERSTGDPLIDGETFPAPLSDPDATG